jgi:hypothetical protein
VEQLGLAKRFNKRFHAIFDRRAYDGITRLNDDHTEFVLGSAAPHEHDLVLGQFSVHTSPDALRDAEAHISAIRTHLVQEGRL